MVDAIRNAFDGALNVTYRGAKRLFLAVVIVAVVVSVSTVMFIAGIAALLH